MTAAKSNAELVMQVSLRMARDYANCGDLNLFCSGLHAGRVQAAEFLSTDPDDKLLAQSVDNELRFLRLYQARHFPLAGL